MGLQSTYQFVGCRLSGSNVAAMGHKAQITLLAAGFKGAMLLPWAIKRRSLCWLQGFYADFARVADDESRHLGWCLQRLEELGYAYGDMVAHSILWEGAQASTGKHDGVMC